MRYRALALQTTCFAVNPAPTPQAARQRMHQTAERIERQIQAAKRFLGPDVRLVALPEYFLTGFPMGESIAQWQEKSLPLSRRPAVDNA